MHKPSFAFILLIAAVLLVPAARAEFIVNAYTTEFSVTSPESNLKVCSCGIKDDVFTITNIGNLDATFTLETLSDVNEWFSLPEKSVAVRAGESREVHVYIKVPCSATRASGYMLRITSSFSRLREVTRQVQVEKCVNIKSEVTYFEKNYNPCETARFQLDVTNVGTFVDEYTISVGEYDQYARITENSLVINPGDKKSVSVYLQLPCDVYGTRIIPFTVRTSSNSAEQRVDFEMSINKAYDYSIDLGAPERICSKAVSSIPVRFTNNADIPNDYVLDYSGPGFTAFEPRELHLGPRENKTIDIITNPSVNDEGRHEVMVKAVSSLGRISQEQQQAISVERCYEHAITLNPALDRTCCGKKTYVVNVQNSGMFEETFYLKLRSPVLAVFSQDIVTLSPGENRDIMLEVDVPCVDDYFEIRVVAESARTGLVAQDVLTLNSLTTYSCQRIEVVEDRLKVTYGSQDAQVSIRNTGTEPGTYLLNLNSHFLSLIKDNVTLAPGEVQNLTLTATNLSGFAKGIYLDELTGTHTGTGLEYKETLKVRLGMRNIIARFFSYVFTHSLCLISFIFLLFGIALALVVVFFEKILRLFKGDRTLFFKRVAYKPGEKQRLLLLLLIAFIVLFAIGFFLSYEPKPALVQKPLYYEMYEDSRLRINASEYFADPDPDDILTYSAAPVENVNIRFENDLAVVTPDKHFFGDRQVVFIAEDNHAGKAESAVITLKVIDVPRTTLTTLFVDYCPFFFLIPLFVIWLALYVYHTRKGRYSYWYREKRKKVESY